MWGTDDERVLSSMERELADDQGVRTAFDDFREPQVARPRRTVVTVLGITTILGVVATGNAISWAGALVVCVTALAVLDARRVPRRCT